MLITSFLLVTYAVVALFLDWTRRIDTIEKRWPKVGKMLAGRKVSVLLLLAAIGLLVVDYGQKSTLQVAAPLVSPAPASTTGPATTFAPNSPANTGNGNTFYYGPPSGPKQVDSQRKVVK